MIEKHRDTLIEQTKSRSQENLEIRMNEQMETFLFNPPINLNEEGKRLLAVTSFEATNSVFNKIDENNSFSISVPGRWRIPVYLEDGIFDELKNLQKLNSEDDFVLHVEEVRKIGSQKKIGDKEYKLSDFDTSKDKILGELKAANYLDLGYVVNRMQLTYNEIMDVLDIKCFPSERTSYGLRPGIYEVSDINKTLNFLLPTFVKVSITIDDIRIKTIQFK